MSAAQAIGLASKKTSTVRSYKVDVTAGGTGKETSNAHAVVQVRLRPDLAATGTLDQASIGGRSVPGGERAILLGDYFYAKVPSQLTQFTGGRPWVRFSVSQAALAKLPGDQRTKMQQMISQTGLDKMDFDLWVDGQDLPRKMIVKSPAATKTHTSTTVTYSGFNAPVSITAPPAGQVTAGA